MSEVEILRRQLRIDAGALRAPRETSQGFLHVDGFAGRVGIYEYPDPKTGKIRRELRPRSEVMKQDALDKFRGAPITNGHPPAKITANNRRAYAVGTVLSAREDGDHVAVENQIDDKVGIAAVKAGRKQLSPGYDVDVMMSPGADKQYAYPGNPEGRYDAVQTNIDVNHLALVDAARGGESCSMRMDEQSEPVEIARAYRIDGFSTYNFDAMLDADARNKLRDAQFAYPEEGKLPIENTEHVQAAMSRFNQTDFSAHAGAKQRAYNKIVAAAKAHDIDSTGFQKEYGGRADEAPTRTVTPMADRNDEAFRSLESQLATANENLKTITAERDEHKTRADSLGGELAEVKKQIPVLQSELATARVAVETVEIKKQRERADSAESMVTQLNANRAAEIRKRVALERRCAPALEPGFKMDGLDDDALARITLKRLDSAANIAPGVSADEIRGRLEARLDMFEQNARGLAQVSQTLAVSQHEDSKKKIETERKEAWRKPLPNAAHKQ